MSEPSDFVGKGWRFPIKVNARGRLDWSEGPQRVQDAVWLIIATALGERMMRPRFGAGVFEYVMQSNSPMTRTALATEIQHALAMWEPRIELEAVRVEPVAGEPSQVLASIDYHLRTTNELFNMVYPFYLEEGAA